MWDFMHLYSVRLGGGQEDCLGSIDISRAEN